MPLFLDLLFILFLIWLITQIFFPVIWPADFERNWIFKKRTKTAKKISKLNKAKREQYKAEEEVIIEAQRKQRESDELNDTVK